MATKAEVAAWSDRIYNAARNGTPRNREGLPVVLSGLLVAQARHETGEFSSNHFLQSNNAFGYSYFPSSDWQIGSGGLADNGLRVAKYASIEDSTREIVDWIFRRVAEGKFPKDLSSIGTPEQYAQLLKDSNYYGDTVKNYAAGLRRFFTDLPAFPFGVLFIGGLLFWLIYYKKLN